MCWRFWCIAVGRDLASESIHSPTAQGGTLETSVDLLTDPCMSSGMTLRHIDWERWVNGVFDAITPIGTNKRLQNGCLLQVLTPSKTHIAALLGLAPGPTLYNTHIAAFCQPH